MEEAIVQTRRVVGNVRPWEWWTLALILSTFLVICTDYAQRQNLWTDEATQLFGTRLSILDNLKWLVGAKSEDLAVPDRMPPLSYWVGRLWLAIAGGSIDSMRFLSVLETCIGITVVWSLGRRFLGRPSGAIAALLLALSPNLIMEGVEIRSYALFFMLSSVAVYQYVRIVSTTEATLWGFVIAASLASLSHFYGVILAGAGLMSISLFATIDLSKSEGKIWPWRSFKLPLAMYAGVIVLLSPFLSHAVRISGHSPTSDAVNHNTAVYLKDVGHGIYRLFSNQSLINYWHLHSFAAVFGAGLLLIGFSNPRRPARALTALLSIGLSCVAVGGLLVSGFDAFSSSYNVWALPIIALLLAATLEHPRRIVRQIAIVVLPCLIGAYAYGSVRLAAEGQYYAHTRSSVIRELINRYGIDNTSVVYLDEAALTYYAITYYFDGHALQYLGDQDGFRPLNHMGPKLEHLNKLRTKYVILAATQQLGAEQLDLAIRQVNAGQSAEIGLVREYLKVNQKEIARCWTVEEGGTYLAQSALEIQTLRRKEQSAECGT